MCNHLKKEVSRPDAEGYSTETCKDCGVVVKTVPSTIYRLTELYKQNKLKLRRPDQSTPMDGRPFISTAYYQTETIFNNDTLSSV
jgi:hypothetical protein